MSRWEFDKQIVIDVRKITGNFITILKMQITDQWHSQEKKTTITKNKASVYLFKHESQKNTKKYNKDDKK